MYTKEDILKKICNQTFDGPLWLPYEQKK